MEDSAIVELYWARDERAISHSNEKYGRMLSGLSYSLVGSREDAEECVNDTYLAAWNSMPDDRPELLGAYLAKLVRRISIDCYRRSHRRKRGGGGAEQLIDELCECIPGGASPVDEAENDRLREALNGFLASLPEEKRCVFVLRYFCSSSLEDISAQTGFSVGKIKSLLHRTRLALRELLEKEELL